MLRITATEENSNALRLRLDGNLDAASFVELESACSSAFQARTIIVDMAGVMFMSEDAARKIAALKRETLSVVNCSPFIETLLESVAR